VLTTIACAGLVLGLVLWAAGALRSPRGGPAVDVPITPADQDELRACSSRAEGLRLLRRHYGLPMTRAAQVLDSIQGGGQVPSSWTEVEVPLDDESRRAAVRLQREGRRTEAIRLVRRRTGLPLVQARDLVDRGLTPGGR
jgi:hypothetical protein